MNNLVAFIAKYYHWFLFAVLEAASLALLIQFNSYHGSVYFTTANDVTGKLYEANSAIEEFFSLTKNNAQLTQRNLYLERQVKVMSEQLAQLTKDSSYLRNSQLALLSDYRLIPAKVITNSISKRDNYITIDKGTADGIHADMGVACGNGIVGVVYMAGQHYSIVLPVLHSQSNISVAIDKRGYFGYLHWKGGRSDLADVDDVPRHAHFRLGDLIVTSGYSSIFPPGLLVGKVLHVFNSADGLSYRVQIRLSTDFGLLRDVCVIDDAPMRERVNLMRAAQDSIKPKTEGTENSEKN